MKTKIHPQYHQTKVKCACGDSFTVGSTKKELEVEICSQCHPFYTGEKNMIDSTGRVERFKKLQEKHATMDVKEEKPKEVTKKEVPVKKEDAKKKSLEDLKKK